MGCRFDPGHYTMHKIYSGGAYTRSRSRWTAPHSPTVTGSVHGILTRDGSTGNDRATVACNDLLLQANDNIIPDTPGPRDGMAIAGRLASDRRAWPPTNRADCSAEPGYKKG